MQRKLETNQVLCIWLKDIKAGIGTCTIDIDITKSWILAIGTSDIGILTETKVPVIKVWWV